MQHCNINTQIAKERHTIANKKTVIINKQLSGATVLYIVTL